MHGTKLTEVACVKGSRRATAVATGIGMAVALAACGGSAESDADVAQLQFWDMVWGPPEYIDVAEDLVEQFNSEHDHIEVSYRSIPWANWYETFTTAIGSGTAPDISTGAGYQSAQFHEFGAILPLNDLVEELRAEGDLADFSEESIEAFNVDGDYIALPWNLDIRVWYYHKDLFEEAGLEPPESWDEMRAAAERLTAGDRYGLIARSDTGGTHYLYSLVLNNGGAFFTEDRQSQLSAERNVEAMRFLWDLAADGLVHPASAGYDADGAQAAFAQGEGAMLLDGPGLKAGALSDVADQIGMMPPPVGPHGDQGTVQWVNNLMLYAQTDHPEESKTFLTWWSRNQLPLWTEGNAGSFPARQSFAADAYFADDEDRRFVLDHYVPVGRLVAADSPSVFGALNEVEGAGVMFRLVQDLIQTNDFDASLERAEEGLAGIVGDE
jgi:multiple sugar transport system substrate-binding protein